MNNINERIQPSRLSIANVYQELQRERYFVDHSFQRRLVWVEKQKIRLIETILMGYPMPEFYLWQQPVNEELGILKSSIVDGQQRMSTVMQFIGNEWPLKTRYLDEKDSDYAGKTWAELSNKNKAMLWNYSINVRTIPSDVTRPQITSLFMRLNETDKSLNPQEIRNAEFNGLFLQAAEKVADIPLIKKWDRTWGIFSDAERRRMADINFASSLLIYQRAGISNDSASNINRIYDLYNDKYDEMSNDIKNIKETLEKIDSIFERNPHAAEFFTKTVHLYTLFVAIDYLSHKKTPIKRVQPRLEDFIQKYKEDSTSSDSLIREYKLGASGRTLSKLSREKRVESLVDWILR